MSRQKRLLSVKELIDKNKSEEDSFEIIYLRLLEELEIELESNSLLSKNLYLINLFITKQKAENFIHEKAAGITSNTITTKYFHFIDGFVDTLDSAIYTEANP